MRRAARADGPAPPPAPPARVVANIDIARIFDEIADLLEIQEGNQFRVRAYRAAARTVVSSQPHRVVNSFIRYPRVKQVQAEGPTRSAVVLACGLQMDLRIVPAISFGAALHYFRDPNRTTSRSGASA